ncbi:MAG: hypothetical protein KC933_40750, partial [Myxococcales bacterium]|nr:hypothetical protein [Myxococcales bacterium]
MTSKRDVQLVRLACKWRWLTAEEGEDCLALSHRLGATVAMEEIIRRRGYLDADALRTLGDAADRATAHRRAPRTAGVAPRGEQTVVRAVDFEALRRGDLAAALG